MEDPVRWIKEEIRRTKAYLASKEERLAVLQKEVATLKEGLKNLKIAKEVFERKHKLPLFSKEIEAEEGELADEGPATGLLLPGVEHLAPKRSRRPSGDLLDLGGSNIKDAAIKILSECHDEWLDYRDVADHAIRRGYHSTKTNSTDASVTRSFLDVMRKMTELERDRTRFRLAQSNTNGRH